MRGSNTGHFLTVPEQMKESTYVALFLLKLYFFHCLLSWCARPSC